MKVVKSAQHYTETALDEIKLLRCVRISICISLLWRSLVIIFSFILPYASIPLSLPAPLPPHLSSSNLAALSVCLAVNKQH